MRFKKGIGYTGPRWPRGPGPILRDCGQVYTHSSARHATPRHCVFSALRNPGEGGRRNRGDSPT
jgi:hypothetical protein